MPAPRDPDRRDASNLSRMLKRSWLLINLLRHHGYVPLAVLAIECGATTRTIRRDLFTLEAAGVALDQGDGEDGSGWRMLPGAGCPCCGHRARESATARLANAARQQATDAAR